MKGFVIIHALSAISYMILNIFIYKTQRFMNAQIMDRDLYIVTT
jgi:hypothetical protein